MSRAGDEGRLARGDHAFDRGQRGVDFFLVLAGAIEIVDLDTHGGSTAASRSTIAGSS